LRESRRAVASRQTAGTFSRHSSFRSSRRDITPFKKGGNLSIFDVAVEIVLDFCPGEMRDVVVGSAMEATLFIGGRLMC